MHEVATLVTALVSQAAHVLAFITVNIVQPPVW
jgi:hypothetical protein